MITNTAPFDITTTRDVVHAAWWMDCRSADADRRHFDEPRSIVPRMLLNSPRLEND